ncbi:hypothetical protein [Streptomyces sp. NBC_01500]|uniref:hypothetical protein n=1 Tax=Streptomyces sp. NBC_01500 TaxID=2903886 RepID=UPI002258E64F|nr:hypothetical protein [Streptomyces sp. NBC_01500]MCX4550255.1 hypothetical protein [Streptomyces sp. NBC_01500]
MIRNVTGSLVALVGAAAAVYSPFRNWYDGRHGSAYRIQDLFDGITATRPDWGGSILIPFAFAALVTVIGVLLRTRWLVALAGVITIGFTVLWMVRVGMAQHTLAISSDGTGLGIGVAYALAGGVLMLLGSALMSGRRSAARQQAGPDAGYAPPPPPPPPYQDAPYGASPYEPGPYESAPQPGPGPRTEPPPYQPYEPYEPGTEHDTVSFSSADLPAELTAPEGTPEGTPEGAPESAPGSSGARADDQPGGATRARRPGE